MPFTQAQAAVFGANTCFAVNTVAKMPDLEPSPCLGSSYAVYESMNGIICHLHYIKPRYKQQIRLIWAL